MRGYSQQFSRGVSFFLCLALGVCYGSWGRELDPCADKPTKPRCHINVTVGRVSLGCECSQKE